MTWFNKLICYRLTATVDLNVERLETALAEKIARPPEDNELSTFGFISPLPAVDGEKSKVLAHSVDGNIFISAESYKRVLPAAEVKDIVDRRAALIEKETGRKVRGKERRDIKDLVTLELVPKLIPKRKKITALVMPAMGLVLVNTATPSAAEDLLSTLREVLGSLPIRPLTTCSAPSAVMTEWLRAKEVPEGFVTLGSALLVGTEKSKANLTDIDLTGEEVQLHLSAGMAVQKLALAWENKVSFRISDKLIFDNIKFDDLVLTEATESSGDGDIMQTFDASMVIMAATFTELLPIVLQALGGESVPEGL